MLALYLLLKKVNFQDLKLDTENNKNQNTATSSNTIVPYSFEPVDDNHTEYSRLGKRDG